MGSGVTGGGAGGQSAPPETSNRKIFADVSGKKEKGVKLRNWEEKKENWKREKGKAENWKWK